MRRRFVRAVSISAVAGLAGLALPVAHANPYVGGIGDATSVNCAGTTVPVPGAPGVGGVCFNVPQPRKPYARITITDQHGRPTAGEFYYRDAAGTTIAGTWGMLCGNRTVPVPPDAARITVYVTAANEAQACGLLAVPGTTGDISVEFVDDPGFVASVPGTTGSGSPNVAAVANVPYKVVSGWPWPGGTDLEFATLTYLGGLHRFAVAGTYQNGMHLIDVTNPTAPVDVSTYDCRVYQADVQVFSRDARTYVAYAVDDYSRTDVNSQCFRDVGSVVDGVRYGTFFIDITDPTAPHAVSFMPFAQGSHNTTIDPSGHYLYSSNADLPGVGTLEVFNLDDIAHPTLQTTLVLGASLPAHDVTFSADGSRAYVAALTSTEILDTTVPGDPRIIGRIVDPTINIHHQADPITLTDPVLGTRTFLIVTDEIAGAEGNGACPGGGLHVFDITGPLEAAPVKVGFFDLPDSSPAQHRTRCTAHVMRMYPDQKKMTIAWYASGVHVLDLSQLVGVSVGTSPTGSVGLGIKQVGWYAFDITDTWSVKAPVDGFASDGSFYMFANDQLRGFDVYHFDATALVASEAGRWRTAAQAAAILGPRSASAPYSLACVLRPGLR